MSSHVTLILDREGRHSQPDKRDAGGPYTALCSFCPWRSDVLPTRFEAARAADFHRLEANNREENP
jgi:hypothetical protein